MRAFEITGRHAGEVVDVPSPRPTSGQVVVRVGFAGICGTDIGLLHADDEELAEKRASHPLRPGHEWSGTVARLGDGVDQTWLGRRVTGDTMLGCNRCARCADGRHHLCENRREIGVRGGWPGALAEELLVPITALRVLPDSVDDRMGALVEPGGNAWRAVNAGGVGAGSLVLVLGSGTIGLLAAQFARAAGAEVHVFGVDPGTLGLAEELGLGPTWTTDDLPVLPWDVVLDATDAPTMPAFAMQVAEPGRRVVLIGVAHAPSDLDSRRIVRKELRVEGVLGASQGLAPAIAAFASGAVDPRPLVAAEIGLEGVADVLNGIRPAGAGPGPKVLVRLST
jgi:threonine dehydrogenase-like Zn-dependent dehydrogenase